MNQQPLQPQKKGFSALLVLPVIAGAGIAIVLLCAAVFAVYAIFFYQPDVPAEAELPTPTIEIVRFTDNENNPPADPIATPNAPASGEQPAEAPSAGSDTPPPSTDEGQQADQSPPAEQPEPEETQPAVEIPLNTAPVTMTSPDYGMQVFLFWKGEMCRPGFTVGARCRFPVGQTRIRLARN